MEGAVRPVEAVAAQRRQDSFREAIELSGLTLVANRLWIRRRRRSSARRRATKLHPRGRRREGEEARADRRLAAGIPRRKGKDEPGPYLPPSHPERPDKGRVWEGRSKPAG